MESCRAGQWRGGGPAAESWDPSGVVARGASAAGGEADVRSWPPYRTEVLLWLHATLKALVYTFNRITHITIQINRVQLRKRGPTNHSLATRGLHTQHHAQLGFKTRRGQLL